MTLDAPRPLTEALAFLIEGHADSDTVPLSVGFIRAALAAPVSPSPDVPDFLDGARAEYRECMEVRRLLGYLWTATGRSGDDPVRSLFDDDDPIVADVERLAIFDEGETPHA